MTTYTETVAPLSYVVGYLNAAHIKFRYVTYKSSNMLEYVSINTEDACYKFTNNEDVDNKTKSYFLTVSDKSSYLTYLQSLPWSTMRAEYDGRGADARFKYDDFRALNKATYVLGYLAYFNVHPGENLRKKTFCISYTFPKLTIEYIYPGFITSNKLVVSNEDGVLSISSSIGEYGYDQGTHIEYRNVCSVPILNRALDIFVEAL